MKPSGRSAAAKGPSKPTHLLFFAYRAPAEVKADEERQRRQRASEIVRKAGGTCEILRISWKGFDMVSVVRNMSFAQVMKLAAEINSWGAVHAEVVGTADIRKG